MTQPTLWTQEQLAQHWLLSEGTLERWRCEGIGPVDLKIRTPSGQVRYRISDIMAFEEQSLRKSTSESLNTGNKRR
jgi:hypothetical protein